MNKDNYIDLILSMKEGDVLRIPMESDKEFNAQRMSCWRGLQALQKKGILLTEVISLKKARENEQIFLEIVYSSTEKKTIYLRQKDGTFQETSVDSFVKED